MYVFNIISTVLVICLIVLCCKMSVIPYLSMNVNNRIENGNNMCVFLDFFKLMGFSFFKNVLESLNV